MARLADRVSSSASMQVSERVQELKRKGVEIIDLSIGEPDFDTPKVIRQAALKAIEEGKTHYTPARGIAPLREAIASFWRKRRVKIDTDNILITPGAKQALFYTFAAILDEGDEVLVPEPCWVSYPDIIKLAGGVPVKIPTKQEDDFLPKKKLVESKIKRRTKAIIINNPSNPTGAYYDRDYIQWLSEFCRTKKIYLISDEIYSDLLYDGRHFHSAGEFGGDHLILVNGVSKMAAMTGWRIGYLSANSDVLSAAIRLQQQTATCAPSISQYAALAAFEHYYEYAPKMLREYSLRRDIIYEGMTNIDKLECFKPEGTFYIFVNIKKLGMNSEEAAEYLLRKAAVAAVPGSAYGRSGEGYLRFSFATSKEKIAVALENMSECLGRKKVV